MRNSIAFVCFFVVLTSISCAQDPENQIQTPAETNFEAVLFVDQLQIPWGMAFLPDGSLLITEKSGQLFRFRNGEKSEISGLHDIYLRGQGGLLDVILHPNFSENNWIYLSYASDAGSGSGGHTAIARARLEGNSLSDLEVLYKGSPNSSAGQHFGSRLAFDAAGYLYFTIGDRGNRDVNPQDITRDGGKVYRIHDDGRIPDDNPFVGQSGAKTAAFTYGNRNPQGMAIHPETGAVWIHEHGPRGGDEINIVGKGNNYGWPLVTYGINYSGTSITDKTEMEGTVQPIHYWVPSIAPSGMAFVTSDSYPAWQGSLLVGSLSFQYLERLELSGNQVTKREKLLENIGRVRNVIQGPDGFIYVAVEGKGIYRLEPR
ncbi:Glucose/arabinose dehydrogenase, beta-propeller fold [Robiginitalea myxolifaciens]|uniref:Glucose/arabinose dehydrogenase, beta-propeller fold n=1 Tax=Robiginitalea myxolifaciens TaxID=400055 RepID=A0A1I6FNB6_9FLAO|nr:PQQ-dependent sugar dehydrogenase [Robiginitalea myxolifaciens]SFR31378.1 Glucose/arabinose dehydrogenase, beta-propeller fold [Robiginitalea myxolifaciens]